MNFKAVSNKDRKLDLNWDRINIYVSRYKAHTPFDVSITRRVARKSDPMRKMYFAAVLPPFAKYLGYDPDEYLLFHRQLKIVFFQCEPDDKGIYRDKSKKFPQGVPHVFANESDLRVPQKREFLDWVLRKAAMEGCYIDLEQRQPNASQA